MKVCLIRPDAPELLNDRIDPPMGLLSLGTSLERHGHSVTILDRTGGVREAIPRADLYGITLFTTSYPEALALRDEIRCSSDAPIVVGGPHARALPELTALDFDYVAIGEAEVDLPPLVEQLAEWKIPTRVLYMKSPRNLTDLPINDYSLVDVPSYNRVVAGKQAFSILSGRGCPFHCTYCFTAALNEGIRVRSPDHLFRELYYLEETYGVDALRFVDDNFLMSSCSVQSIMPLLKEFGRPYRIYCRAVDLTPDRCKLLASTGCKMVACGVESGSQHMQNIMNTEKDVGKMTAGIISAKRCGLHVRVGLIVGYPGETWETVRESVWNLKKMPFDSYNLFNFVPLPGTDPYNHPRKYGITHLSSNWKEYFILCGEGQAGYAFEHQDLTPPILADMRSYMIHELNSVSVPALCDEDYR